MEDPRKQQTKAIVALAFRNGPIEDVHAWKACPTCSVDPSYSWITQDEMKVIMKNAVDSLYTLLRLRDENPVAFQQAVAYGLC